MSAKEKYISFCQTNEVPLFFKPFWLDIHKGSWDVCIATHDSDKAYWVFSIEKKLGFTFIRNPHLTPYTGIIFSHNNIEINIQQELISLLMAQLPRFDLLDIDLSIYININSHFIDLATTFRRTNLLILNSEDQIYNHFKPSLKRQIRKAEKLLTIFESNDIELFYKLHEKTFLKQDMKPSISLTTYKKYWSCCSENNCGKLFFIRDTQMNVHAALLMVYDVETSYYLAGGTDDQFYGSGAMSNLMWHAIKNSITMNKKQFDFEGSELPTINQFFKNFSPIEHQYIHLKKVNSVIYKMIKG